MKQTTIKYYCDYCNKEMREFEYDKAISLVIRAEVPDPRGGCGSVNGIRIKVCNECAAEVGFVIEDIMDGSIYQQSHILRVLQKFKIKIIELFKSLKK